MDVEAPVIIVIMQRDDAVLTGELSDLWFGLETTSKVLLILSIAIFPMIINTYVGIKDTRGSMLDIGRAFGASERQIFFKIILPGSIPYVMAGARLAVGLGIIGMIIAEFFTAMVGFGGWIRETSDTFETAQMYFLIIVVGAFGIVLTCGSGSVP